MPLLFLRSFLFALFGLIVVPIVAFFGVLALAYAAGGCGPGDAGGCQMGAAGFAIASAIPGFAIFFFVTLIRGLMRRKVHATAPPPPEPQ
ncbi:MAG: hypothetical protein ACK4F5_08610 [Aliihoeflea sp.]